MKPMTIQEIKDKIKLNEAKLEQYRDELGNSWSSGDGAERAIMNRQIQVSMSCLESENNDLSRQLSQLQAKEQAAANRHTMFHKPRVTIDMTGSKVKEIIDLTGDEDDFSFCKNL